MKYIIGGLIALLLVALILGVIVINKKSKKVKTNEVEELKQKPKVTRIEKEDLDKLGQLIHIKDITVCNHLFNKVKGLSKLTNKKTKGTNDCYKVTIASNKELIKSNNLNPTKVLATGANVLNVTSLLGDAATLVTVVYYMDRIDNKLDKIRYEVLSNKAFSESEYSSKVRSIINYVQSISKFMYENLNDNDRRLRKIEELKNLEKDCTLLLGQTIDSISKLMNYNDINYDRYLTRVDDAYIWANYQNILLNVLYQVENLLYTFNLGEVSNEEIYYMLETYKKDVYVSQYNLSKFHTYMVKKLDINLNDGRKRKEGLGNAVSYIPGLFKEEYHYIKVPNKTLNTIREQLEVKDSNIKESIDLSKNEVDIVVKDGNLYYVVDSK